MPAFQVSQSIAMDRPPEQVFDTDVDHKTWTTRSPWLEIDRDADVSVEGAGREGFSETAILSRGNSESRQF